MKRCPTCGNTYTNDKLAFCLEDGAKLVRFSDAQSGFDPQATLRISAEENAPPKEETSAPYRAPTLGQPASPLTVPPRPEPRTSDNRAPAAAAASSPGSTSPAVIAGITAIVVLLLVIAGIGIALLVRDSSSSSSNTAVENKNGAANNNSNRNASNTANSSTGKDNSSNKPDTNEGNRTGTAQTDALGRAEAKVVRGSRLDESELSTLSRDELRRLRNSVYARHGRMFDSPELQRYFDSRPWYRPRSDYGEEQLTETDRANIKLIQTVENSRA